MNENFYIFGSLLLIFLVAFGFAYMEVDQTDMVLADAIAAKFCEEQGESSIVSTINNPLWQPHFRCTDGGTRSMEYEAFLFTPEELDVIIIKRGIW